MQGTDDLEEAMSERLQELPPPLGRRNSHSRHDGDGFSFPQDMDTDAAGPSRVGHACLAVFSSMQTVKFSSKVYVTCVVCLNPAMGSAWPIIHTTPFLFCVEQCEVLYS